MRVKYLDIPRGEKRLLTRRGNAYDVARVMGQMVNDSVSSATIKEFVKRHPMNAEEVFNYAYHKASFKPDEKNEQIIKTPFATIFSKRANCVCYSVLIATLLKANNIRGFFRLIRQAGATFPQHIYVVTETGEVLDCVIGQDQTKETSRANRENKTGRFNEEAKYFAKFDSPY